MLRILGAEASIPTKFFNDKKSTRESCNNENDECKIRHASIYFHNMRELVAARIITPCHACSEENIVDVLTKSLVI